MESETLHAVIANNALYKGIFNLELRRDRLQFAQPAFDEHADNIMVRYPQYIITNSNRLQLAYILKTPRALVILQAEALDQFVTPARSRIFLQTVLAFVIKRTAHQHNQSFISYTRGFGVRLLSAMTVAELQWLASNSKLTAKAALILIILGCALVDTPRSERCPVCMSANVDVATGCNHKFCTNCLFEWYKQHNTCPICRATPNKENCG